MFDIIFIILVIMVGVNWSLIQTNLQKASFSCVYPIRVRRIFLFLFSTTQKKHRSVLLHKKLPKSFFFLCVSLKKFNKKKNPSRIMSIFFFYLNTLMDNIHLLQRNLKGGFGKNVYIFCVACCQFFSPIV